MISWAIVVVTCALQGTPQERCDEYVYDMLTTPSECNVELNKQLPTILREKGLASFGCERAEIVKGK